MHPVILLEVADIFHASGGKIVHQQDLVAPLQQTLRQVGTNKTRAAGNEIDQAKSSWRPSPGRVENPIARHGGPCAIFATLLRARSLRKSTDNIDMSNSSRGNWNRR